MKQTLKKILVIHKRDHWPRVCQRHRSLNIKSLIKLVLKLFFFFLFQFNAFVKALNGTWLCLKFPVKSEVTTKINKIGAVIFGT